MASIYDEYAKLADQARLENMKRAEQVESIFDEIITRYGPGGSFGAGYEAQLGRQKTQDVSRATQGDISRGLSGLRNRGAEWEATTGSEARLRLEDLRMERLSSAQQNKASFLERIENPYPDYSALMQLAGQGGESYVDPRLNLKQKGTGGSYGSSSSLSDWLSSNFARPSFGGGSAGVADTSRGRLTETQLAREEERSKAAQEVHNMMSEQSQLQYTPGGDPSALATGETVPDVQSIAEGSALGSQPPSWTGNYRTWKAKMDEYNKSKGLPTTGY